MDRQVLHRNLTSGRKTSKKHQVNNLVTKNPVNLQVAKQLTEVLLQAASQVKLAEVHPAKPADLLQNSNK